MKELRCKKCDRLLGKYTDEVEIVCKHCKKTNRVTKEFKHTIENFVSKKMYKCPDNFDK